MLPCMNSSVAVVRLLWPLSIFVSSSDGPALTARSFPRGRGRNFYRFSSRHRLDLRPLTAFRSPRPGQFLQTWRRRSATRRSVNKLACVASRGSKTLRESSGTLTVTSTSPWSRTEMSPRLGTTTSPWPTLSGTTWWAAGSVPSSTTMRRTPRYRT